MAMSVIFTVTSFFGFLYLLLWQTYVLRADVILNSIEIAFIGLEVIFSIVCIIVFSRYINSSWFYCNAAMLVVHKMGLHVQPIRVPDLKTKGVRRKTQIGFGVNVLHGRSDWCASFQLKMLKVNLGGLVFELHSAVGSWQTAA